MRVSTRNEYGKHSMETAYQHPKTIKALDAFLTARRKIRAWTAQWSWTHPLHSAGGDDFWRLGMRDE